MPLSPLPFHAVTFTGGFWAPRLETNRAASLPHILHKLEETGRISAFDLDFERPVPTPIVYIFGDSDPAKWIEAASCSLHTHPDPQLESALEGVIARVVRAQQPDGYLNTHFTRVQPELRWRNLRDWHELYCAGHLIEAAVAHFQATGRRTLLDALCRYADHIDATFGPEPGKKRGYCGHPEIELALVRLYRATGTSRYLKLASYFVEERGRQPHYFDLEAQARGDDPARFWAKSYEYCQAQAPVRQQTKVVGHAVRAMYLSSAMADLAGELDDPSLLQTCQRLWENLITRRLYLTGGIGPSPKNEGFTEDYDLPDETAYAETCATIGLMLWNQRLLQLEGDSKYADGVERGLFNGFLSGVSLDGRRFFYENPLASAGNHHRQDWFDCPCCPPNLARILASLGQFFYSTGPESIWVHQYAQGTAHIPLAGQEIVLQTATGYPWDGTVRIRVGLEAERDFELRLRRPGWCSRWQVRLNGVQTEARVEKGYVCLSRTWQDGDVVELGLEMPVQPVYANPAVRPLEGRVALQRGPLVYCLEGVDHGAILLDRVAINGVEAATRFTPEHRPNLLGGVTVLKGSGVLASDEGWEGLLYQNQRPARTAMEITAVPYFAWDNRAPGEMRVWLREEQG